VSRKESLKIRPSARLVPTPDVKAVYNLEETESLTRSCHRHFASDRSYFITIRSISESGPFSGSRNPTDI
jgi:hypothetical protein